MSHDGSGHASPFVSFLTTAYQTEQYVRATIESVMAQTRGDWELIVVDNGNSDEMARIVGSYLRDPRITLLRQENKGYVGGVGAAAAVAVGRYVCVLDSDDLIEPEYCERVGALIDADPGIDAVGCNALLFCDPANGQKPGDYFASTGRRVAPDPHRPASFGDLVNEGVPHYAGAIRRATWDALGGYDSSPEVEPDVVLWLRLARLGDVRILPEQLVRARVRDMSLSKNPANIDAFEDRMQRSFMQVSVEHGLDESSIARTGMLRRLQYHGALRRARSFLVAGDVHNARIAARDAFDQCHTVRAAAAVAGLHLCPNLVIAVSDVKNRTTGALRRLQFRATEGVP